ncbi:hypothetical protein AB1388_08595, partial [Streptomyces hydrogenans]
AEEAPSSAEVLARPLEVAGTRLPGRLVRERVPAVPGPGGRPGEAAYDCDVVAAGDAPDAGAAPGAAPLLVVDLGPCPRDPAEAEA